MLDQYLQNKMADLEIEVGRLKDKMRILNQEEMYAQQMIETIIENQDLGIELFSPRGADETSKEKVQQIKKQIEQYEIERIEIEEKLSGIEKEMAEYQNMRNEIAMRNEIPYHIKISEEEKKEENSTEYKKTSIQEKEELKIILSRVDKCIGLLDTDRKHCKSELMNLKYYLKALISDYSR